MVKRFKIHRRRDRRRSQNEGRPHHEHCTHRESARNQYRKPFQIAGMMDNSDDGYSRMSPALTGMDDTPRKAPAPFSWPTIAWVSVLLAACYAPVLYALLRQWSDDPDMGHGFFVPIIAGAIVWHKRDQIAGLVPRPNWWGLVIMAWAGFQLYIATLGAELFLARTSLVISIIGAVILLGGTAYARIFAFPLFLLFFMVPIPAVIYNQLTFPLQQFASSFAETLISWTQIPVVREGNILILPSQSLNVVEACSGIRSLLTLTFFSLVYGYVFEKRGWARAVLFFSTIPITIAANAGRVALTGVVSQINPDLAEGWFHEAQGMVIFVIALAILIGLHQLIIRTTNFIERRHA
jgi:exosortase